MSTIQDFAERVTGFLEDFMLKQQELFSKEELKYTDLMQDAVTFSQQLSLDMVQYIMERFDEAAQSAVKKERTHYVQAHRERRLVTSLGELTFTRTYFKERDTDHYEYLLDNLLQIQPYQRIDEGCAQEIMNHVVDMSYAKAARLATPIQLSRQSVLNLLKRLKTVPNAPAERWETVPREMVPARLFIEADEDHVAMQDGKNTMVRLIYTYEGKMSCNRTRRQLVGKHAFTSLGSGKKLWEDIDNYLRKRYGADVYPQVTIIGDGAAWIKNGCEVIPNAEFAIDFFHYNKYMKKIIGNKEGRGLRQAIKENDRHHFNKEVRLLLKQAREHDESRVNSIQTGVTYIRNHWDAIRLTLLDPEVHSSTEAHVSHMLSTRLSSRPMGWSRRGAETIAKLRIFRENGGQIKDLYTWATKENRVSPQVKTAIVKKTFDKKNQFYISYGAASVHRIPGSERGIGKGFRFIKNGGFEKIM